MAHISVLLHETIDALQLGKGNAVLDATFGGGGHSREIAERIGTTGHLYAIDQDADAFDEHTIAGLRKKCQLHFAIGNFRDTAGVLDRMGAGTLDAAVFDLGLSSRQLDESGRGFSFRFDEPLSMTFSKEPGSEEVTAEDVLNRWSQETLADIFRGFGEEPFAGRIARRIVEDRMVRPFSRTGDLVESVLAAIPARFRTGRIHPATRVFQAVRMAVNDELGAIATGIPAAIERLRAGGRIAVITFHSVEDRAVKQLFRSLDPKSIRVITKRPIVPTQEEIETNPRSRSAKLRVAEKIEESINT